MVTNPDVVVSCALHMADLGYLCLRNLRITRGIVGANLFGKMTLKGERERSFLLCH
jgi:hypothetical protein